MSAPATPTTETQQPEPGDALIQAVITNALTVEQRDRLVALLVRVQIATAKRPGDQVWPDNAVRAALHDAANWETVAAHWRHMIGAGS